MTLLQQMLRTQERVDPYSTDMLMAQLTMLLLVLLREAQALRRKAPGHQHGPQ